MRTHPATRWQQEAQAQPAPVRLRLAAMAAHMQVDEIAARRAALVDVLIDGRPHLREEIWETVAEQLGEDCWGKLPRETLQRDLRTLRAGGLRIAYSRRPGAEGYYLEHPPLAEGEQSHSQFETVNEAHVANLRRLTVAEKNEMAFAAAAFALKQKRLILAEQHPEWPAEQVEREARKMVYGAPAAGWGGDG